MSQNLPTVAKEYNRRSEKFLLGVLIPYSSIYPMGKKYISGLKHALDSVEGFEYELFPEYISEGQVGQVIKAINKLNHFHDVDYITGLVSSLTLKGIVGKVQNENPMLVSNIGEHIPGNVVSGTNVQVNSDYLWMQIWAIGHWAVTQFGTKGLLAGSLYDIGYCFLKMLRMGMTSAKPGSECILASGNFKGVDKPVDMAGIMDTIEREAPDFVFCAFCGKEAQEFMNAFIKRGLHRKILLISSRYFLGGISPEPVDEELVVYSAIHAFRKIDDSDLEEEWTKPYGIFEQLGKEAAKVIINKHDNVHTVSDDRENIALTLEKTVKSSEIYILENRLKPNKPIKRKILCKSDMSKMNYRSVIDSPVSGWQNIYMGI